MGGGNKNRKTKAKSGSDSGSDKEPNNKVLKINSDISSEGENDMPTSGGEDEFMLATDAASSSSSDKNNPPPTSATMDLSDLRYNQRDVGPFIVMIEKPKIDLLSTSKTVCQIIGKHNLEESRKVGPDRLRVKARNYESANKIMNSLILKTKLKLKMYVPKFYLTSVGVVDDIPLDYDLEQIKKEICSSHQVINIERMKRLENGVPVNIDKIKVEFRSYQLPYEIQIFCAVFRVRMFIPKPTFCKKCLSFGHVMPSCRNKERCSKCAQERTDAHACTPFCKFCQNPSHTTGAKDCPQTEFQKRIKYQMVKRKIPYREARTLVEAEAGALALNPANRASEADSTMAEIVKLNKTCDSFKKRTSDLITMTQMIAKMAFDDKEKGHTILDFIRDTLSEKRQLYELRIN
ncbi:hypothetical protein DMENIID0001_027800 [Sergentomyia squamirostris]